MGEATDWYTDEVTARSDAVAPEDAETSAPDVCLAVQLDPESSRRLLSAVDRRRRALGRTTAQIAEDTEIGRDVLYSWAYKAKNNIALRIDLDKALSLLAAVGVFPSRVDELASGLSDAVTALIDDLPGAAS